MVRRTNARDYNLNITFKAGVLICILCSGYKKCFLAENSGVLFIINASVEYRIQTVVVMFTEEIVFEV